MQTIFLKQLLYNYLLKDYFIINFSEMDCFALLSCAIEQKIEAILYKKICEKKQLDNLPKTVKKQLYINYVYNLQKNKLYLSELNKIKLKLQTLNVPIIPEKGIFLIANVYDNIAVRYMEDIDIVAMLCDFEKIQTILENNKYKLSLINDKEVTLPVQQTAIQSCLFAKTENLVFPLPFIKIDISYTEREEFNSYNCTAEIFCRLCKYIYNSIDIKNPSNCRLNKLLDIIYFIRQYPSIKNSIFDNQAYCNIPEIKYIKDCINFYNSI